MAGKLALLAGLVTAALAFSVAVPSADALPPCSAGRCHSAGTWFWNKQSAQYQLLIGGLDITGKHYEASSAICYGLGRVLWGSKGPEFQRFHCAVKLTDGAGNTYPPYGLTFYVQGHYAWTWSSP